MAERVSEGAALAAAVEEGRIGQAITTIGQNKSSTLATESQFSSHPSMSYPVGKPLEVNSFYNLKISLLTVLFHFHPLNFIVESNFSNILHS